MAATDLDRPMNGSQEAGLSEGASQDVLRSSASETQKQAKPEEGCREYQIATDCYVHRFIVKVLGGVVAVALVGSLGLTVAQVSIPDIFLAFGSGALGALAGLLAPPPSRQGGQRPVV
jgi:hypothetical protein